MSVAKRAVPANRLISAMAQQTRLKFLAGCEKVDLEFAEIICESGDRIRHVYFPVAGIISLVTSLADHGKLEVGIVGDEGMLGTSLVLGVNVAPQRALVQGAGSALRMSATAFRRQLTRNPALRDVLDRYLHVVMSQLAQTAACSHFHVVEARLARWLLMTRDRAHSDAFDITHEFLAYMLGVRRVGVTQAASALQAKGFINYRRGKIVILDGVGLEKAACRCYASGKQMYDAALG